jgi:crotonobetainyl-CoA:carnitine CoA-transferase CaiB-like acyl-CoA transferase
MLGSLIGVAALQTSEYFGTGKAPRALGSAHPRNAPYQAFQAKDDYFIIAAGNDRLWQQVCEAVGRPELARDPRFTTQMLRAQNQLELVDILNPLFLQKTAAEWLEDMDRRGVPCAPINDYPQILSDPQVAAMELVRPLRLPNGVETKTTAFPISLSGYRFEVYRGPPELGADNEAVLTQWLAGEKHD